MREDTEVVFQAVSQQGLALQFAEAGGKGERNKKIRFGCLGIYHTWMSQEVTKRLLNGL